MFDLKKWIDVVNVITPRLLAAVDNDPFSPTYGCFDREHWMYKLHDFPSGVVLQSNLYFACLFKLISEREIDLINLGFHSVDQGEVFKEIAISSTHFNLNLLLKNDGQLDEYFPGEKSLPPTAFCFYSTLKTIEILDLKNLVNDKGIHLTAEKLLKIHPSDASNQDMAAAAGLNLYGKMFNRPETVDHARYLIKREKYKGQFIEYGGFDVGYASVTLNFLAYAVQDGLVEFSQVLVDLANKLTPFINFQGFLGGEYCSRNTSYFLPFGYLKATEISPDLAGETSQLQIQKNYFKFDDRYLLHYSAASFGFSLYSMFAFILNLKDEKIMPKLWPKIHVSDSILRVNAPEVKIFAGLNKGGAVEISTLNGNYIHYGYSFKSDQSKLVYRNCEIQNDESRIIQNTDEFFEMDIVSYPFAFPRLTPSPFKTIVLRLISFLGSYVNKIFKSILIKDPKKLEGAQVVRKILIDWKKQELSVVDSVSCSNSYSVTENFFGSSRLVPSAKFFNSFKKLKFEKDNVDKRKCVFNWSRHEATN